MSRSNDTKFRYKIRKGFITQKIDNKITIFDEEKSYLYTFNETASYVFKKIKLGWERKQIVDALVRNYNIKEKQAQEDFASLTKDLLTKKIIIQNKE